MSGDAQERSLPATDHRLRRAREKGQVAGSASLVSTAVAVGGLAWLLLRGDRLMGILVQATQSAMSSSSTAVRTVEHTVDLSLFKHLLGEVSGLFLVCAICGIVANIAHKGGLVVSFDPLTPDMNRLSVSEGFKRMFSRRSWLEFLSGLLACAIWCVLVAVILRSVVMPLLSAPLCGFGCTLDMGVETFLMFSAAGVAIMVVAGVLDLPFQVWLFKRDMRMSHQELRQEHKETEGSPEVDAHRTSIHRSIARGETVLPTLVFVSANAAVSLRYHPESNPVPVLVAKGTDAQAIRIRTAAERLGIAVFQEPEITKRLIGVVNIGSEIPAVEFGAIAPFVVLSASEAGAA